MNGINFSVVLGVQALAWQDSSSLSRSLKTVLQTWRMPQLTHPQAYGLKVPPEAKI
jgi:hypothetical protein